MTTPENGLLLAALRSVTAQLGAAERLADALRGYRDRLVIQLAEGSAPHGDIAAAAAMTVQGIGKITRAAGLARYRRDGERRPRRASWPPPRRASVIPSSSAAPSTTRQPEPS